MLLCRVLRSLEQFAAGVEIDLHKSETVQFIRQSFAVVLVDIIADDFQGQTFNVIKEEVTNITSDVVNTKWSMMVTNGSEEDAMDDSVATIHIPKQSLTECAYKDATPHRIAYFAFFKNSLFQVVSQKQRIASLITAARLNCSINEFSTPIGIMLSLVGNDSQEVSGSVLANDPCQSLLHIATFKYA